MKNLITSKTLFTIVFISIITITKGQQEMPCTMIDTQKVMFFTTFDTVYSSLEIDSIYTPPPPPEEERLIYWVHGLGGDKGNWIDAATAVEYGSAGFPRRKAISIRMGYKTIIPTIENMDELAIRFYDKIKTNIDRDLGPSDWETSMIIAHSQGGIVTRAMQRQIELKGLNKYFGGFATFGSPHRGAYLLNSAKSGADEEFISEMVNTLTIGEISNFLGTTFKANLILLLWDYKSTIENVVRNWVAPTVDQYLITLEEEEQTDDYYVGSPWLNGMESYELNLNRQYRPARVAFYGVEPDEGYLIWRTLNYFKVNPNELPNFGANADNGKGTLKYEMDRLIMTYKDGLKATKTDLWDDCGFWDFYWTGVFHPWDIPKLSLHCAALEKKISAFEDVILWYNNVNKKWKVMIGALSYEKRIIPGCSCTVRLTRQSESKVVSFLIPNDNVNCIEALQNVFPDLSHAEYIDCTLIQSAAYEEIIKESDGVVLAESARDLPAATYSGDGLRLNNTSHMQMRNSEQLKAKLKNLFDGDYGMFFYTKTQN